MSMKLKLMSFAVLLAGLMSMGTSLFAHHGDAAYVDTPLEIKNAVVTEYKWMNPHSLIKVKGKDDKGVEKIWTMEMGSTPSMTLLGFSRTTMKPGDVVTVMLYPTKNGTPVGRMHRITFPDGTQLFDQDQTEPASKRAEYAK